MEETKTNPLLAKLRLPGRTFALPSKGIFYTNGELADGVVDGEVEVYPLTAIDEIVLSTPDKLLSGKAIIEVFGRCIPQVVKAHDLLAKDVDFLLQCLRLVSFGDSLSVTYNHFCLGEGGADSKEHTYEISMEQMIRKAKAIDPTRIAEEYQVVLTNGQVVVLRPLSYGDVIDLYQSTALKKTEDVSEEEVNKLMIKTLTSIISSVDGVSDKELIAEWAIKLPLGWKKLIETSTQNITQWGGDTTTSVRCRDCGKDIVISVDANPVNFFT